MADANISVIIGGATLNVFMSYGLLTKLSSLVPNPDMISTIGLDRELRDQCLGEALAPRSDAGDKLKAPSLHDLSVDDANRLLEWMQEHLLDFFLKQVKTANRLSTEVETALTSSTDGSPT